MVVISFDTNDLHRRCCEYAAAEAAHGHLNGSALLTMIADIEATTNCSEMIELFGPDAILPDNGSILLNFGSNLCAEFIPVGPRFECDETGRIKWQTVSRLKLVRIERRN
jgi:hypothetical protein